MSWAAQPERGAPWATRVALFLALRGGQVIAPVLVMAGTGWFLLTSRAARAASGDYLRRVLERPVRPADIARHFHSFAWAVLDRVLLLSGREQEFTIRTEGIETLLATLEQGRGCIMLGAHLGSFEVLRTVARHAPVPVWALMYRRNAGALTTLLDRLSPGLHRQVLEIGDTASMIRARECVERGEMVGILADRAPDAGQVAGHRMVAVPFLGELASFPSGPFVLASTLAAPVVLFHAVRTGRQAYHVRFEPFIDQVVLRRGVRSADLHGVVARYAAALERLCRACPYQWFNFFAFWERCSDAEPDTAPAAMAPAPVLAATPGRG